MQAVQLRRITRERDRADRIAQFMTDIFKVADPEQKLGNTVTARDVLESRTRYRHGSGPRLRTPGAPDVRDLLWLTTIWAIMRERKRFWNAVFRSRVLP